MKSKTAALVAAAAEWAPDAGVRVTPSVLGSGSTEIRVLSALDDTHRLRVLDVLGRSVRSLDVERAVATWDLKDRRGVRVPDGTYWVVGPTGDQVGRIVVVR